MIRRCLRTKRTSWYPDLPYAALETPACAAFIKESRLKRFEVTSCTGDPGYCSNDRSRKGRGARLAKATCYKKTISMIPFSDRTLLVTHTATRPRTCKI